MKDKFGILSRLLAMKNKFGILSLLLAIITIASAINGVVGFFSDPLSVSPDAEYFLVKNTVGKLGFLGLLAALLGIAGLIKREAKILALTGTILATLLLASSFLINIAWNSGRNSFKDVLEQKEIQASAGDSGAMLDAGAIYARLGDFEKSYQWYRVAAEEHELLQAMYVLGRYNEQGLGVDKNITEALKWYRIVAENEWRGEQFTQAIKKRIAALE